MQKHFRVQLIKIMKICILLILSITLSACHSLQMNEIPSINDIWPLQTSSQPKSPIDKQPTIKPTVQKKKYKIALFLPLDSMSPSIQKAATSLLNASQLAYKEINNPNMDLLVYATDGKGVTIEAAAMQAVENKIDLIIGPLLSPSVVTVRRYTEPAGIPMLAFSNDKDAVNGGLSYLLSYLPEQNVSNVVSYAINQGHTNFGIFASNTPYGKRISDIYQQEVSARQGRTTNIVNFTENGAGFYEDAKEIAELEIRTSPKDPTSWSAIMFADRANLMADIVPLFQRYHIDFKKSLVLGTGLWNDPNILNIDALSGAVFAAPNHKTIKIFEQRYQDRFQEKPLTIASLAYDAIALASGLIREYPENAFSVKNITNPNGFTGVGGIFRFRNDGLSERGLSIMEIKDHQFNVVVPAPNTFVGS